jgi:hypothetical protein
MVADRLSCLTTPLTPKKATVVLPSELDLAAVCQLQMRTALANGFLGAQSGNRRSHTEHVAHPQKDRLRGASKARVKP